MAAYRERINIFQNFLTNVIKDFLVSDSGAFSLIKWPVATMEGELFFWELMFILINFLNVDGLTIHIDDEFLIRVGLVLLERSDSYHDLDAICFAGHFFGLAWFIWSLIKIM